QPKRSPSSPSPAKRSRPLSREAYYPRASPVRTSHPATADNHMVQLTYRFEGGGEVTGILETNKIYPEEKYSEE
ncbi:hypothetical protein, partial [Porphyromonas loveana]|uniref:hypothetical protein n=1 Tax=Porphyromonas loveana TaxID=1884669 RepID=UPI00359FCBDA